MTSSATSSNNTDSIRQDLFGFILHPKNEFSWSHALASFLFLPPTRTATLGWHAARWITCSSCTPATVLSLHALLRAWTPPASDSPPFPYCSLTHSSFQSSALAAQGWLTGEEWILPDGNVKGFWVWYSEFLGCFLLLSFFCLLLCHVKRDSACIVNTARTWLFCSVC